MQEGLEKQGTPPVRELPQADTGGSIWSPLTLKLNKAGPHTGFFCSWLPRQMLGLFKVGKMLAALIFLAVCNHVTCRRAGKHL